MIRPNFTSICILLTAAAAAQPHGIAERVPNTTLLIDEVPAAVPEEHNAVRVYPNVMLPGATRVMTVPGTGELLLIAPSGLRSFPSNDPNAVLGNKWFEPGPGREIIDAAFPRGWSAGAPFLVTHFDGSEDNGTFSLSLFTAGSPTATTIESFAGIARNGVSGSLLTTPDGDILLGIGDHGAPDDIGAPGSPLGTIQRLDPDTFEIAEEIATGLRVPHLAVDPVMESVFASDFAPSGLLEVNRVRVGYDFGWPEMAGFSCYPPGTPCDSLGKIRPVYWRDSGTAPAFVGGAFSYDRDAPDLHAMYLLAEGATGKVTALRDTGSVLLSPHDLFEFPDGTLSGIGRDDEGVVYFIVNGGLYVLRPADGEPNSFPTRLSDNPALLAAGAGIDQTTAGVIPYRPSATLWSDNARKERFIALPGTAQIGFRERDGWDFPNGGMVIKNFIMPTDERAASPAEKRLETRIMLRLGDTWQGFSYRWNEEETDAVLLPRSLERPVPITESDGNVLDYAWLYPSRTDCFQCHTEPANRLLGVNTGQMNFEITYPATGVTDNQLRALDHISIFEQPLDRDPSEYERMPDQRDITAPLQLRARAFLHANCAFCHRPGGGGQIGTDFRWSIPLDEMGIHNDRPSGFDLDIQDAYLLRPGHPDQSVLPARMQSLNSAYRMPPLATTRVSEEELELIREWIRRLQVGDQWVVR